MLVTHDTFAYAAGRLAGQPRVAVDTETTGLNLWAAGVQDRMVGISASVPAKEGGGLESFYFPFRHLPGGNLPESRLADLHDVLHAPGQSVVGANAPYDAKVMAFEGFRIPDRVEDAISLGFLMNENEPTHALKPMGDKYLGPGASLDETVLLRMLADLGFKGKDAKKYIRHLHPRDVDAYACSDTELAWRLIDFYEPHARTWGVWDLWHEVNRYSLAINAMEMCGLQLDMPTVDRLIAESAGRAAAAYATLSSWAGYAINPQSAPQLAKAFGIRSTAKKVLDVLIGRWEAAGDPRAEAGLALQAYRSFSKARNTYYDPYLEWMDPQCRVHANLNIMGTYAGRCSCKDPNLQAVPRYDKMPVKDAFVVPDGDEEAWVMVELDYSQAEMRVACHFAGEQGMADILRSGGDMHAATAAKIQALTRIQIIRDDAKRINFGILYGLGVRGLSENLAIERHLAQTLLEGYHNTFPGFRRLYRTMQAEAERRGYIRWYSGRVRHFNTEKAEPHKAMSNLIQGTVAELQREKITGVYEMFPEVRTALQVHDSLVAYVPRRDWRATVLAVKEYMEDTFIDPAMVVDVKAGTRWGQLKKVTADELRAA